MLLSASRSGLVRRKALVRPLVFLFLAAMLLAGCSSTRREAGRTPAPANLPSDAREVDVQEKLQNRAIWSIEQLLEGEPGVYVEGQDVRIRGNSGPPLWVIDGLSTYAPSGVNPEDVDRMWISPSGMGYGRRGGNGVVLVTTKRG